ncbi:MAG: substrate-binding domain-containing protein [Casimicrobiaceae bacterium]|nr:substrate-binding domain-containing protein [Casimicrobiaceae bacterium]
MATLAPQPASDVPATPRPASVLTGIGSMATRHVHAALAAQFEAATDQRLVLEAVGGVDAAHRVASGEAFDLVLLAQDALVRLAAEGHVRPDSVTPLMRSQSAVAVAEGAEAPDISSLEALKAALSAAPSVGHSTGPSGKALRQRLAQWGLAEQLAERLVEAPPGVPVAQLIAEGRVALGIQQLSELRGVPGVRIVGLLPPGAEIDTVFGGAVGARAKDPEAALAYLCFVRSSEAAPLLHEHGMEPIA